MESESSLTCFAHLNAPNASLYADILSTFARARSGFQLNLRAAEVRAELSEAADEETVASALDQLCQWGNLEAFHDNSQALSLEEFYKRHLYYQLTGSGVAVIRAVDLFRQLIDTPASLQATALAAVRDRLAELIAMAKAQESADLGSQPFDAAKASSLLDGLFSQLDSLTDQAQEFFRNLQATVELRGTSVDAFLAFKERLVHYLERFLNQVVTVAAEADELIDSVDTMTVDAMLDSIARHRTIDEMEVTEARVDEVTGALLSRWQGVVGWFVAPDGRSSQADELRGLARMGIREVAAAASRLNQRRGGITDRSSDLRSLAVAFAHCHHARDAHRLWRTAFALSPARHFSVSDATLVERDQRPIAPSTSWSESPPLLISPSLRKTGRVARSARLPRIVDNREELAQLREATRVEAEQLQAARAALLTHGQVRISELETMDAAAFPMFLDLLGEALTLRGHENATIQATSTDGAMTIELTTTGDGGTCSLESAWGVFQGPDFWINVQALDETSFNETTA